VQVLVQTAIQQQQPYGYEERVVRPDGSVRVLQTIARVYGDGARAVRVAGCCQDITERKQTELARSRLVQLVESSDDAIIGVAEDATIENWNAAAAKMFGYRACEVVGNSCSMLVPSHQRSRVGELMDCVRAGEHVAHYEMPLRRKDGTLFDGSVTLSAVIDDTGRVVGMSKVIRDVTDQRRVEEQLRSSLREKEVLLREIHHRVKNNLQVIASLLNMQVAAQGSDARKGLNESQDRIHSMALVHQLLYQSKDLAVIDFGEYLTKLTNRLAQTYSAAPDRVLVHVSASAVGLDIDRAIPCGLIINELVTNALTHAFPEGHKGHIDVDLRQESDNLVLTVADDGVGMSPHLRIEEAQTFGLRIARTLTLQLGGTIEVSRDEGTRVRVTFPAMPQRHGQGSN
jgi:PAS domain S-box-containing protein